MSSPLETISTQTTFSKEELQACGHGQLFDHVEAKLPTDKMLMMDRITHIQADAGIFAKGEIIAEYDINPDNWFFSCHFVDEPLMPGSLMLEGLWQTLGFYLVWSGYPGKARALGVSDLKLRGEVMPDAGKVEFHIDIKRVLQKHAVIAVAQGKVVQGGKDIVFAKDLRVGLF